MTAPSYIGRSCVDALGPARDGRGGARTGPVSWTSGRVRVDSESGPGIEGLSEHGDSRTVTVARDGAVIYWPGMCLYEPGMCRCVDVSSACVELWDRRTVTVARDGAGIYWPGICRCGSDRGRNRAVQRLS